MKTSLLDRFAPLMLLALFNLYSNATFSNSTAVSNLDPRDYDYLQADQNSHAFIFKEISVSSYFQLEPEDFSGSSGFVPGIRNPSLHKTAPIHANAWVYLPDLRNLIEIQIFPFHFFW